jgi:hypothetical protein
VALGPQALALVLPPEAEEIQLRPEQPEVDNGMGSGLMSKKFEVRGVRCPYSDLKSRKVYNQQPTDQTVNLEVRTAGDPMSSAIMCLGFPKDSVISEDKLLFRPLFKFPNPDRHAFSAWKLTPVKNFAIDISNEEWLAENPEMAELMK